MAILYVYGNKKCGHIFCQYKEKKKDVPYTNADIDKYLRLILYFKKSWRDASKYCCLYLNFCILFPMASMTVGNVCNKFSSNAYLPFLSLNLNCNIN